MPATLKLEGFMQEFTDEDGVVWNASVVERTGPNYKGRFSLHIATADASQSVTLSDIAWNSRHTAQRTLDTMSSTELRRRLRIGLGRHSTVRMP